MSKQEKHKKNGIEERVARRGKRNAARDLILLSAYFAIGASMAIMAPNSMRLLKYVEKAIGPSPRLKRRISQKYSELIAQGLLKRTYSPQGLRVELTERGKELAERLALQDELRPEKQKRWDYRWRIIMFDIWERRRKVRDELRHVLEKFGFVKVQNSVWVYPYPCEKLLVFLRTHLKLGRGILYIVADEMEHDEQLRMHFKLPRDI